MITTDDRRARHILINTYTVFEDPRRWARGKFETEHGTFQKVRARCLMGELRVQCGLAANQMWATIDEDVSLYLSLHRWFTTILRLAPEQWNDVQDVVSVRAFLAQRIADLDCALIAATAPPNTVKIPPSAEQVTEGVRRSLLASILGLFSI